MGKISSYPEDTNPMGSDFLLGNDGTPTTKRFKVKNLPVGSGQLSNTYRFSAYRAAALTPGVLNVVGFDTKNFDPNNNFDITTNKGRYTVPIDGVYQFEASLKWQITGAPQDIGFKLEKNGTTTLYNSDFTTNMYNGTTTGVKNLSTPPIELSAGDYVEIVSLSLLALVVASSSDCMFGGYLISAS